MAVSVPWSDWDEWRLVYTYLFNEESSLPVPCSPTFTADIDTINQYSPEVLKRVKEWEHAKDQMQTWSSRCVYVPYSIESTLDILQVILLDWNCLAIKRSVDMLVVRLSYGMAITRAVNYVVDELQQGEYAQSIMDLALKVNLPRWIVDIRHEVTHGATMSSLETLRSAANEFHIWSRKFYWDKQQAKLRVMAIPSHVPQRILTKIAGRLDDIDVVHDQVDLLARTVPCSLYVELVVPVVCTALMKALVGQVTLDSGFDTMFQWERVLCAVADKYDGFGGNAIAFLFENLKNLEFQVAIYLVRYLISRRWLAFTDESVGITKGLNVGKIHPSNLTKKQKEWITRAAPPRFQDRILLLTILEAACLKVYSWSIILVSVLLPAIADNKNRKDPLVWAQEVLDSKEPLVSVLNVETSKSEAKWSIPARWAPCPPGTVFSKPSVSGISKSSPTFPNEPRVMEEEPIPVMKKQRIEVDEIKVDVSKSVSKTRLLL